MTLWMQASTSRIILIVCIRRSFFKELKFNGKWFLNFYVLCFTAYAWTKSPALQENHESWWESWKTFVWHWNWGRLCLKFSRLPNGFVLPVPSQNAVSIFLFSFRRDSSAIIWVFLCFLVYIHFPSLNRKHNHECLVLTQLRECQWCAQFAGHKQTPARAQRVLSAVHTNAKLIGHSTGTVVKNEWEVVSLMILFSIVASLGCMINSLLHS